MHGNSLREEKPSAIIVKSHIYIQLNLVTPKLVNYGMYNPDPTDAPPSPLLRVALYEPVPSHSLSFLLTKAQNALLTSLPSDVHSSLFLVLAHRSH